MAPIAEPLLLALFVAVFVMMALLALFQRDYDRLMRERHPEVLEALGREDVARGRDHYRASPAALRYLWRRGYRKLRDPELDRVAGRIRALLVPTVAGFATLAIGFAYNAYCDYADKPNAAEVQQDKRNQALTLHNQGRYEEAIRLYDQLLGPVGADGELVYWRGVAHWKTGREEKALQDFYRVMELRPGWFEAYFNADRLLSKQRRFDECVDLWNTYLRLVPGDAAAHMERGGSHYHRGDFPSAFADATRACELGKNEGCVQAARLKSRM